MAADDYEDIDYAYVRDLVFPPGWTPWPSEPGNPKWHGMLAENAYFPEDPIPSGQEGPTIYAGWRIDYDTLESDYEGESSPARWGRLTVERYLEKGAKKEALRRLATAIKRTLDSAPEGPIGFDLQRAKPVRVGYVGGWYVENLVIPFCGG